MFTGQENGNSDNSIANTEEIEKLHNKIEQLHSQIDKLQTENKELHRQLQETSVNHSPIPNHQSPLPDLEQLRTKTLNKMKVGRQSAAGKALDYFIKLLKQE